MPESTPDKRPLAPSVRRLSPEGRRALEMLATSGPSGACIDNADGFKPLDEIAELIGSLTYGEMVEVASELRKAPVETKQIDKLATLIRLSDLRRNDRTRLRIAGSCRSEGNHGGNSSGNPSPMGE
jgi:hypothetical protein